MANLADWREKIFLKLPAAWQARLQNNFLQRCVAAVVLSVVSLCAIWLFPVFFPIYVWFFILVAVREWQRMTEQAKYRQSVYYLYFFIILLACMQALFGTRAAFAVLAILPLVLWLIAKQIKLARPLWFACSIWYLGAAPLTLIALHQNYTIGTEIVTYFLGVVWATDTAAFLIGRQLGGALIAPDVSPKKTWSGFIGGLVAGTLAGVLLGQILETGHVLETFLLSFLLSVAAQISDLVQSKIKRSHDIKDTGGIIPGHGGVLDRIDSLMLSAPLYALIQFLAGRAVPW